MLRNRKLYPSGQAFCEDQAAREPDENKGQPAALFFCGTAANAAFCGAALFLEVLYVVFSSNSMYTIIKV